MKQSLPRVNDSFIDKIIYINLDHRIDRKASIERQLSVFSPEKIVRLSAVYTPQSGFFGCAMSHINALHMAIVNKFKNVLIVEDDFMWNNIEENYCIFEYLARFKKYDVIALGGPDDICYDKETLRTTQTQAPVAYLVNNHYFELLCCTYIKSVELLQQHFYPSAFAIDQYWKIHQPRGNWYAVRPPLCYQLGGYSDIENKFIVSQIKVHDLHMNTLSDFFNLQTINLYIRLSQINSESTLIPQLDKFTEKRHFNVLVDSEFNEYKLIVSKCLVDILFLDFQFNENEISKIIPHISRTQFLIIADNQESLAFQTIGWTLFGKWDTFVVLKNPNF